MRGATGWQVLVALLLGVALGWGARSATDPEPAPLTADLDTPLIAETWEGGITLTGRGAAASVPEGGRAVVGARNTSEAVLGPAVGFDELASLCALTNRTDEFHRLAAIAVEGGISGEHLLAAVNAFPVEQRPVLLDHLRATYPDLLLPPVPVAEAYMAGGAPERAVEILKQQLETRTEFDYGVVRLLVEHDAEAAVPLIFEASGSALWTGRQLEYLQQFLDRAGKEAAVVPFLTRRLESDTKDDAALDALIDLAATQAMPFVRARIDESPEGYENWVRLAEIHLGLDDEDAAFEAFGESLSRTVSSDVLNRMAEVNLERALPILIERTKASEDDEALGALAKALHESGQAERALEVFERAFERDPADGEWTDQLIELAPERAERLIRAQLGDAPKEADDEMLGNYADALTKLGRTREAFDYYRIAHEKDTDDSEWLRSMASTDPARAIPILETYVRENGSQHAAHAALSKAFAAVGRKAEALTAIERALHQNDSKSYYVQLARLDAVRAHERLKRSLLLDPGDDELWGSLGWVLAHRGMPAESRAAYERAAEIDPEDGEWQRALKQER